MVLLLLSLITQTGAIKKVRVSSMNSILWHRQTPSNSVQDSAHTYKHEHSLDTRQFDSKIWRFSGSTRTKQKLYFYVV